MTCCDKEKTNDIVRSAEVAGDNVTSDTYSY